MGTAVVATLLSSRTAHLLEAGYEPQAAQVGGMTWGFWFGLALSVVVLGLLLRLPSRPATTPDGATPDGLLVATPTQP